MQKRIRLFAAYALLTLFFHLKKKNGLNFGLTLGDVYLLVSWLGAAPNFLDKIERNVQRLAATGRSTKDYVAEMKKDMNVYQNFIYSTTPVMASILESGGMDRVGAVIVRFTFQLFLVLTAPVIWIGALLSKWLKYVWRRLN
ncbi:hypothetical protein KTT66_10525 [Lacticaseibacillus casei]|jgi:hypothetical protein|uniref:Uncharacterized protein n=1 Tax=Lacticaseibacillus huelsenbergensis TaxID=3035291 RepID=A0ABY8DSD8_9LACO|nr:MULTISPECIES: hypothetical protein [Lacticaseibacillus]MDG3062002.1 hypothetical protein [Lacticaseibacillus sp. BCRC 81376]QVI36823.1 hypothetical protein KGS74_11315 [Lacticaseibacillus casei]QXG58615.1 hypothetical protein KTT66_10525 [Lacticaseibacillus casei]WFB39909.1 hypothetical protein LHUE1_000675 [Lacticaseibacillus huelsenbergensis]WFB41643.1 hypothetical protein LHUE2_002501 [Lacticaseibacillus huelsenbergensis]